MAPGNPKNQTQQQQEEPPRAPTPIDVQMAVGYRFKHEGTTSTEKTLTNRNARKLRRVTTGVLFEDQDGFLIEIPNTNITGIKYKKES